MDLSEEVPQEIDKAYFLQAWANTGNNNEANVSLLDEITQEGDVKDISDGWA